MGNNYKKKPVKNIIKKNLENSPGISDPTTKAIIESFKALSVEDQDEIIRTFISDGGLTRLASIIRAADSPGIWDIISDQVSYWHFYPAVNEE
ncbi:MAG: hypothetical protein ABIC40_03670 [bacterium]